METELLAQAIYDVKTVSALKFDEHLKEPLAHDLLLRVTKKNATYLKAKLTKSEMEAVIAMCE